MLGDISRSGSLGCSIPISNGFPFSWDMEDTQIKPWTMWMEGDKQMDLRTVSPLFQSDCYKSNILRSTEKK